MKKTWLLFFFLFCFVSKQLKAQVQGLVTDQNNNPLSFVNIYLEGSVNGTITNESGYYELDLTQTGTYTVVFKYLGYATHKEIITISSFPHSTNIVLSEENVALTGVEVSIKDNPANRIIRSAISQRNVYRKKISSYTADFYSKGLIKIEDAPKAILGQDLGDFGGGLDSTRSGIIYLSETISKIAKNNKKYKEKIIASKVSGDDNGFSFNNASDVDFSYYNNTIELGNQLISPIADNAFTYYKYKLIGTFYDDNNILINQITVIPKRPNDKVFTGTIYIVEDQWSLYAVDLRVSGIQAQILAVDSLYIKQSFNYSKIDKSWIKVLQSIDFEYGIFGVKGGGKFTAAYKNYNLNPEFSRKDFTNEVLSFEKESNKKDSLYWGDLRPVPLTIEEKVDYKVKDSVRVIRKSKTYLDSIDTVNNTLKLSELFFGYSYDNTYKKKYFTLESPLRNTSYNTVQGWSLGIGANYTKNNEEKGSRFAVNTQAEYGLSDVRFRPSGAISYRFNNFSRPFIRLSGGNQLSQFNDSNPISKLGNSFRTLFLESNFAKFYDKSFVNLFYSQELVNGISLFTDLGFEDRKPSFNTTNFSIIGDRDTRFLSNNPLDPDDFDNAAFVAHNLLRFQATVRFRFGQKYLNYPNGKFNLFNYTPTLLLGYEKGFASSISRLNFNQVKARVSQNFPVGDKGDFAYNFKAGAFINPDDIAFIDFQHFNGSLTRVGIEKDYLNSYFLLPYYDLSTNNSYFEGHAEHNFKGYIMGKIPLLNKLNSNLIIGGKVLATSTNQPYTEFSIGLGNLGWKKFRFLRIDFAQSNFEGVKNQIVFFGVSF